MNNDSSFKTTDNRSRVNDIRFSDNISVLHVDDEEAFLKATKIYLEHIGEGKLEVDSLVNPEHVFKALQEKTYDVIIADYRMPSIDGLQLLKQLRSRNITIPYIMLTGRGREEVAIQALNLGANRYIKKGMDTESQFRELVHAIRQEVRYKRTQDALRESEEQLRAFMDSATDNFSLFDSKLNFIDMNLCARRELNEMMGIDSNKVIGMNLLDINPTSKETGTYDKFVEVIRTGKPFSADSMAPDPKYGDRYFNLKAFKVGKGLGLIATDITEHQQAEEALKESETRLKVFIEAAPDYIQIFDSNMNYIAVNKAVEKELGLHKDEILGKHYLEVLPHLKGTERYDKYKEVIRTGKPFFQDGLNIVSRFGDKIFSVRAFKVGTGLGMIISDDSERKRAENAMKARLKLEQLMGRLASDFVNFSLEEMDQMIIKTLKVIAEYAGAVRSSLFLFSEGLQTVTNTHEWCKNPENSQIALLQNIPSNSFGYYWELLQQKKNVIISSTLDLPPEAESEWEWIKEHGWQSLLFVPMVFKGRLYGTLGFYGEICEEKQWSDDLVHQLQFVATIITNTLERKKMEQEVIKYSEQLEIILDNIPGLIFYKDMENRFIQVNQYLADAHQMTKEELKGKSMFDLYSEEEAQAYWADDLEVIKSGKPKLNIEEPWDTHKGRAWLRTSRIPFENEEGEIIGIIGFSIDITERKKAEKSLQKSEEKYRSFLENFQGIAFRGFEDFSVDLFSGNIEEITGYTEDDFISGKMVYYQLIHPEDISRINSEVTEFISSSRRTAEREYRIIDKNGKLHWIQEYIQKFYNEARKMVCVYGTLQDITIRKQAEENLLIINRELQDFASIVAHDLKAPLRNITNLVEWILRDSVKELSEEGKDNLNLIVKQTTHMNALVDGIYQYSKIDRIHKKITLINLNELLSDVIKILSPPRNIEISIQTELPVLAIDKTHIIQIFSNLLDNAVKFIDKPKGHITIKCEEKQNYWRFSVADNGPGIEERHFERIFQMFQTLCTWDESKGTGIGLAIVQKVVEMNGGIVWLESTLKEGSTFFFTLPKR